MSFFYFETNVLSFFYIFLDNEELNFWHGLYLLADCFPVFLKTPKFVHGHAILYGVFIGPPKAAIKVYVLKSPDFKVYRA